jgi:hypothetical protein
MGAREFVGISHRCQTQAGHCSHGEAQPEAPKSAALRQRRVKFHGMTFSGRQEGLDQPESL